MPKLQLQVFFDLKKAFDEKALEIALIIQKVYGVEPLNGVLTPENFTGTEVSHSDDGTKFFCCVKYLSTRYGECAINVNQDYFYTPTLEQTLTELKREDDLEEEAQKQAFIKQRDARIEKEERELLVRLQIKYSNTI